MIQKEVDLYITNASTYEHMYVCSSIYLWTVHISSKTGKSTNLVIYQIFYNQSLKLHTEIHVLIARLNTYTVELEICVGKNVHLISFKYIDEVFCQINFQHSMNRANISTT